MAERMLSEHEVAVHKKAQELCKSFGLMKKHVDLAPRTFVIEAAAQHEDDVDNAARLLLEKIKTHINEGGFDKPKKGAGGLFDELKAQGSQTWGDFHNLLRNRPPKEEEE